MRIFKESTLYLLGTGLGRGLPFLLLPVLTLHLSVEDYGRLSLATTIAGLLAIIIGMNPNLYVFASFFKYDRQAFSIRLFNILILAILSCLPVILFYVFVDNQLYNYSITFGLFVVLIVIGLNRSVAAMHLAVEQMERKPVPYFVFYLLLSGFIVFVMFFLIASDSFTWQSMLFIESGVFIILNLIYIWRLSSRGYLTAKFDRVASQDYVRFSAPLLGHAGALWAISFFDRFVIAELVDIESVGVYSVAHTISLGISLIHESAHRAWQPIFFRMMQSGSIIERKKIIRYTWIYSVLVVISAAFYLAAAWLVVSFFLPPSYAEMFDFLPFLVFGFALLGMYRFVASYFYHYGDTRVLTFVTIGSSLIHVIITLVLVSTFGTVGAAYAVLVSYFILLVLTVIVVTRLYNIEWMSF